MDIKERIKLIPTIARYCHAATSDDASSASPRGKFAAARALLHAVKKAQVSVLTSPIQF
jgi:hypothetical protein